MYRSHERNLVASFEVSGDWARQGKSCTEHLNWVRVEDVCGGGNTLRTAALEAMRMCGLWYDSALYF